MMALGMESADEIMSNVNPENRSEMQNLILANIEEVHNTEGIYTT